MCGSGKFELCAQNGSLGSDNYYAAKDGNSRELGFAVHVIPPIWGLEDDRVGPDDRLTFNLLEMLLEMSARLHRGLQTMSDHQEYDHRAAPSSLKGEFEDYRVAPSS